MHQKYAPKNYVLHVFCRTLVWLIIPRFYLEAGILGYNMHVRNQNFQPDDGLVGETPEETIANIGRLGKQGMKYTNEEIIKIMVGE